MRYIAAYFLASLSGKDSPTYEVFERNLSSVGIETEPEKLNKVISELKGKDLAALITEGRKKLSTVTTTTTNPAAESENVSDTPTPAPAKAEEKKEERRPEIDSEDEYMGFSLFD